MCVCLCAFSASVFSSNVDLCRKKNCGDHVKLVLWMSTRAGIYIHVIACVCVTPVCFSLVQESQEKWRRSCSRWTESDRRRERWSEFLVKAAGQWGRQKLIREAASFTTPQLDRLCACVHARVCVQAANQLALPVSESVSVWCVCVCIYHPCSTGHHTLPLLSSSIWLAHPNKLITISGKPLLPNKCQLYDNLQTTLEETGCCDAEQVE